MVTRRRFIIAGTGVGVGVLTHKIFQSRITQAMPPSVAQFSPSISKFTETLPIPPIVRNPSVLRMAPSSHSFHSSLGAGPTWGYNGASYLGPTIEVTRGTPLEIKAVNALGRHPLAEAVDPMIHGALLSDKDKPRASVHLHGGNTEPNSDGFPEATFKPGETYTYNYNNDQEACTLWYHDHALGITRLNVMAGLAGFYLIRDEDDPIGGKGPLGIPAGPPYEVPLVLQDRSFNPDGSLFYPSAPWEPEFFGDVPTVNGKAWAKLNVDRTMYRFRILNGSNARFYRLKLSSNQPMFVIGTDGGLINAPKRESQLIIAPGQRRDVLIDFSKSLPGDKIILQNDAPTPFPGLRMPHGRAVAFPMSDIMQFTVNKGRAVPKSLPNRLRVNNPLIKPLNPALVVQQRFLTLVEV